MEGPPNRDDVRQLARINHGTCASLYLPTRGVGPDGRQDSIRLGNLLREAGSALEALGDAGTLLDPARAFADLVPLPELRDAALAILLSEDDARAFRIPYPVEALAFVGERFHLSPLLPLAFDDDRFFVLALSQKRVTLYRGDRYGLHRVALDDVPQSLSEALGYRDKEVVLQYHTATPRGAAGERRAAMFHGHGAATDDHNAEIVRFVSIVAAGIRRRIARDAVPCVLAGVDEIVAAFRGVRHGLQVCEGRSISGNPDGLEPVELHGRAWSIVADEMKRARGAAVEEVKDKIGGGRGAGGLAEVLPAAAAGRVETAVLAENAAAWGRFEPSSDRVIESFHRSSYADEDLFDRVGVETVRHGGTVVFVAEEDVPLQRGVAASYRF